MYIRKSHDYWVWLEYKTNKCSVGLTTTEISANYSIYLIKGSIVFYHISNSCLSWHDTSSFTLSCLLFFPPVHLPVSCNVFFRRLSRVTSYPVSSVKTFRNHYVKVAGEDIWKLSGTLNKLWCLRQNNKIQERSQDFGTNNVNDKVWTECISAFETFEISA